MSFTAEYITRLIANTVVTSKAGLRDAYGFMRAPQGDRAQRAARASSQRHTKGCDPYNHVGKRA